MYDAAKAIRKERRTAIRVGVKVLQAQQEQKAAAVQQYYHGKIDKDIAIYECEAGDRILEGNTSKCVANKIKPVKRLYAKDIMRILSGK